MENFFLLAPSRNHLWNSLGCLSQSTTVSGYERTIWKYFTRKFSGRRAQTVLFSKHLSSRRAGAGFSSRIWVSCHDFFLEVSASCSQHKYSGFPNSRMDTIWFLVKRRKIRRRKRIQALTAYLKSVNANMLAVFTRMEDEFSFLEDEIYKTTTALNSAKEIAVKNHEVLKHGLQILPIN